MKYLKKFNEQNTQNTNCDDFYHRYKNIVDFNENDYGQGEEPSNVDLLSEIGDLCNDLNMTRDDVKWVLDNYDCSFDYGKLLQITYDVWVDENEIEPSLKDLVERILDAAKLDVDDIKESDPELIGYIGNMIKKWSSNR